VVRLGQKKDFSALTARHAAAKVTAASQFSASAGDDVILKLMEAKKKKQKEAAIKSSTEW